MTLDAGSLGHFVRRNNGAGPAPDLQPSWMNKLGGEGSLGVNIHVGPNYEGATQTASLCNKCLLFNVILKCPMMTIKYMTEYHCSCLTMNMF